MTVETANQKSQSLLLGRQVRKPNDDHGRKIGLFPLPGNC
jgi:hypothetical protein